MTTSFALPVTTRAPAIIDLQLVWALEFTSVDQFGAVPETPNVEVAMDEHLPRVLGSQTSCDLFVQSHSEIQLIMKWSLDLIFVRLQIQDVMMEIFQAM